MSLAVRFSPVLWVGLVWAASIGVSPASADAGAARVEAGDAAAIRPQSRPDLSGHWVRDPKTSDDPRERIRQATKQAMGGGPRGGMGRGGGMGGGMGGGRPGGGPGGGMAARGEGPSSGEIAELVAVPKRLDITHDDPLLVLADEHDGSSACSPISAAPAFPSARARSASRSPAGRATSWWWNRG